jgi:hypothetical protein
MVTMVVDDDDGKPSVIDRYSKDFGVPTEDSCQGIYYYFYYFLLFSVYLFIYLFETK